MCKLKKKQDINKKSSNSSNAFKVKDVYEGNLKLYMLKKVLIPSLFALFTFGSCEKSDSDFQNDECIEVKVLAEICGTAVLQIQNSKYYNLGEKGWSQENGKTSFDNVFFTVFSCEDMEYLSKEYSGKPEGKSFNIKIQDKFEMGNCAVCLAIIANPPAKRQNVKVAKNGCPPVKNG